VPINHKKASNSAFVIFTKVDERSIVKMLSRQKVPRIENKVHRSAVRLHLKQSLVLVDRGTAVYPWLTAVQAGSGGGVNWVEMVGQRAWNRNTKRRSFAAVP